MQNIVSFSVVRRSDGYGVATISRLLQIIGLFCRIESLLEGSFVKESCNFKEPTKNRPLLVEPFWRKNLLSKEERWVAGVEYHFQEI